MARWIAAVAPFNRDGMAWANTLRVVVFCEWPRMAATVGIHAVGQCERRGRMPQVMKGHRLRQLGHVEHTPKCSVHSLDFQRRGHLGGKYESFVRLVLAQELALELLAVVMVA